MAGEPRAGGLDEAERFRVLEGHGLVGPQFVPLPAQRLLLAGVEVGNGVLRVYLLDPRTDVMRVRAPRSAYHVPTGDRVGPTLGGEDTDPPDEEDD
eukprot:1471323-Lingulodinium_polyedra.AAC.1